MGKKLYRSGEILSITINPAPHRQYLKEITYKKRIGYFVDEWVKIFYEWYRLGGIKSIQVYKEISWKGLIHYHGCVVIDDPRQFATIMGQICYLPNGKTDVNIDIDTIDNMDTWLDYCKKDADIMGLPLIIPLVSSDMMDASRALPTVAKAGEKIGKDKKY